MDRMGGAMLVILAACQSMKIKALLIRYNVRDLGAHLRVQIGRWMEICPEKSPSVEQILRTIGEVERLLGVVLVIGNGEGERREGESAQVAGYRSPERLD